MSKKNVPNKLMEQTLDTAIVASYDVTAFPAIFEKAFFKGASDSSSFGTVIDFYAVDVGKLNVESGKVVATDPAIMHDAIPFAQQFPIGRFPVQLSIARIEKDQRVAFSRIVFSNEPVFEWKSADRIGQKPLALTDSFIHGFSVDAGLGIFIDSIANVSFDKLDQKEWKEVFINNKREYADTTWSYLNYSFENHNLVSFSTGFGDGSYGCYIGYTKDGKPCRLLTDFGLSNWWQAAQK